MVETIEHRFDFIMRLMDEGKTDEEIKQRLLHSKWALVEDKLVVKEFKEKETFEWYRKVHDGKLSPPSEDGRKPYFKSKKSSKDAYEEFMRWVKEHAYD